MREKIKNFFKEDLNLFIIGLIMVIALTMIIGAFIEKTEEPKEKANLTSYEETITDNNFYRYTYYGLDDFRSYTPYTFNNIDTTDNIDNITHNFCGYAINPVVNDRYYDNERILNSPEDNMHKSTTVYLKSNTYYFIKVKSISNDTINNQSSYELFIHNRSWSSQFKFQLYDFAQTLPVRNFNYNRIYLFNTSLFDNNSFYWDNNERYDVATYNINNVIYYPFVISNTYANYFDISFSIYEVYDFPLDYFSGLDTGVQISYSTNNEYESAYQIGKENGYNLGYVNGYNNGVENAHSYTFFNLIGAVIDAPLTAFKSMFNFNFLGFNMLAFIEAILSIMFIVFIIRIIAGG